jgi:hypothetical protein
MSLDLETLPSHMISCPSITGLSAAAALTSPGSKGLAKSSGQHGILGESGSSAGKSSPASKASSSGASRLGSVPLGAAAAVVAGAELLSDSDEENNERGGTQKVKPALAKVSSKLERAGLEWENWELYVKGMLQRPSPLAKSQVVPGQANPSFSVPRKPGTEPGDVGAVFMAANPLVAIERDGAASRKASMEQQQRYEDDDRSSGSDGDNLTAMLTSLQSKEAGGAATAGQEPGTWAAPALFRPSLMAASSIKVMAVQRLQEKAPFARHSYSGSPSGPADAAAGQSSRPTLARASQAGGFASAGQTPVKSSRDLAPEAFAASPPSLPSGSRGIGRFHRGEGSPGSPLDVTPLSRGQQPEGPSDALGHRTAALVSILRPIAIFRPMLDPEPSGNGIARQLSSEVLDLAEGVRAPQAPAPVTAWDSPGPRLSVSGAGTPVRQSVSGASGVRFEARDTQVAPPTGSPLFHVRAKSKRPSLGGGLQALVHPEPQARYSYSGAPPIADQTAHHLQTRHSTNGAPSAPSSPARGTDRFGSPTAAASSLTRFGNMSPTPQPAVFSGGRRATLDPSMLLSSGTSLEAPIDISKSRSGSLTRGPSGTPPAPASSMDRAQAWGHEQQPGSPSGSSPELPVPPHGVMMGQATPTKSSRFGRGSVNPSY